MEPSALVDGLLEGNPRALAKLLSLVEDRGEGFREVVDRVFPHTGGAYRVGVTGPPGVGKSTLVDRLVPLFREDGTKVGVLASDPTSPFSGGALLGDRVRMRALIDDEGVFIRSLATRGGLGGLFRATYEASLLLEAAGYGVVVYETIGVGQAEIDVVRAADSVAVVLTPQSGDAVQALKAGLMEIADVFVINKADQEGADRAAEALQVALSHSREGEAAWTSPILKAVATEGEGLDRLKGVLDHHRAFLGEAGLAKRRNARLRAFVQGEVEELLRRELWDEEGRARLDQAYARVLRGERGPFRAASELLEALELGG